MEKLVHQFPKVREFGKSIVSQLSLLLESLHEETEACETGAEKLHLEEIINDIQKAIDAIIRDCDL